MFFDELQAVLKLEDLIAEHLPLGDELRLFLVHLVAEALDLTFKFVPLGGDGPDAVFPETFLLLRP